MNLQTSIILFIMTGSLLYVLVTLMQIISFLIKKRKLKKESYIDKMNNELNKLKDNDQ